MRPLNKPGGAPAQYSTLKALTYKHGYCCWCDVVVVVVVVVVVFVVFVVGVVVFVRVVGVAVVGVGVDGLANTVHTHYGQTQ